MPVEPEAAVDVESEAARPKASPVQLALEEGRFRCITQCYWRGKLWHVGDTVLLAPGVMPPRHFKAEN